MSTATVTTSTRPPTMPPIKAAFADDKEALDAAAAAAVAVAAAADTVTPVNVVAIDDVTAAVKATELGASERPLTV
jgi:hypothetical protein